MTALKRLDVLRVRAMLSTRTATVGSTKRGCLKATAAGSVDLGTLEAGHCGRPSFLGCDLDQGKVAERRVDILINTGVFICAAVYEPEQ